MKTLKDYAKHIAAATTKEELHSISYECLLQPNSGSIHFGKKGLYNSVIDLCVKRQRELDIQ